MNIYTEIPAVQSKKEKFINKAIVIHGELYSYEFVEYTTNRNVVKIKCKVHGIFEQRPDNHLSGKGCKLCGLESKLHSSNTENFIENAKCIHETKYNYELVEYIHAHKNVAIVCKIHGIFEQSPTNHLSGKGCHKCGNKTSKIANKWLESLNITDILSEYRLPENLYKCVDGYSPSTNTVYQFHGDYWHGNPLKFNPMDKNLTNKKTYGELYEKTIESDLWILSLGYNLITMWESDFNSLAT